MIYYLRVVVVVVVAAAAVDELGATSFCTTVVREREGHGLRKRKAFMRECVPLCFPAYLLGR